MAGDTRSQGSDDHDESALERAIADHIAAVGPIGFDEYMAHALYTPGLGFYRRGGGAGRRRDFLTSPEVGPLFGAVLARALDSWWEELGRPDRFTLVEVGAGPGTLARTMLAAEPRCRGVMDVVLVESGDVQWSTHPDGVTSRADLPAPDELVDGPVVVLANELLDNLPFALVERTVDGWAEVTVALPDGTGPGSTSSTFVEELRPLEVDRSLWCDARAPQAHVGARIPVQADAGQWLADVTRLVSTKGAGRVVAIDYASTSEEMAQRDPTSWLRTYAAHGRAGSPLEQPGSCDITCEVAVDQLALVRPADRDSSQAEFLRTFGIDELVEAGRQRWVATGISGGLEAIAGRSRIHEAEALLEPDGLGAFRVLEWVVTLGGPG